MQMRLTRLILPQGTGQCAKGQWLGEWRIWGESDAKSCYISGVTWFLGEPLTEATRPGQTP